MFLLNTLLRYIQPFDGWSVISQKAFMFCWQCISIHPCNENQFDALFIFSLFCQ